jgi:hypothetical protein
MKKSLLVLAGAFAGLLGSCSSDDGEVKSSENYIKKFEVAGYIGKPKNDQNKIHLVIFGEDYETLLSAEPPNIEASQNATLSDNCKNSVSENFLCTVIAENGDQRTYSIYIDMTHKKYSFEKWVLSNGNSGYSIPSDSNSTWTSGNAGISLALQMLSDRDHTDPKSYPTRDTADVHGSAVLMETLIGGTVFGRKVPLFSGNFILGNFNESKAITDELSATEVGQIYRNKPKSIKGYYKYKEGLGDFMNNDEPELGRNDSCSMIVKFYQSDSDTTLTVRNIDTSDLVIAEGSLQDCSETDGDEFHLFEVPLVYKSEPDFENHRYKLGVTFAASKDGDKYAGKIGTRLIIDEIEIIDYDEE